MKKLALALSMFALLGTVNAQAHGPYRMGGWHGGYYGCGGCWVAPALIGGVVGYELSCLLYTSPSPRDGLLSRMPSSA